MAVRAITRCQKSSQPTIDGQMSRVGAPPKQIHGDESQATMDVVECHDQDVDGTVEAKPLPLLGIELGDILHREKSKSRCGDGKDSGGMAVATPGDVEGSDQERRKLRLGTQNPSR